MGRVEGKVAIVTGGASGIGKAAAETLGREGAIVIVTDVQVAEGEAVAAAIEQAGGTAAFIEHDVTSEQAWVDVVAKTTADHGGPHILVNNAGIGIGGLVWEMTLEDFRRQRKINLDGVFLGVKHAIPPMAAAGGGSIINISSLAGLQGGAGLSGYNATKGGVRIFTKGVARECAAGGMNIRCNSVHPGIIDTPIWSKVAAGSLPGGDGANQIDVGAMAEASVPMVRSGTPQDIANGILFLASEDSSYMTGTELVIDGGMHA